jgi:excisionase family DNA binding protein
MPHEPRGATMREATGEDGALKLAEFEQELAKARAHLEGAAEATDRDREFAEALEASSAERRQETATALSALLALGDRTIDRKGRLDRDEATILWGLVTGLADLHEARDPNSLSLVIERLEAGITDADLEHRWEVEESLTEGRQVDVEHLSASELKVFAQFLKTLGDVSILPDELRYVTLQLNASTAFEFRWEEGRYVVRPLNPRPADQQNSDPNAEDSVDNEGAVASAPSESASRSEQSRSRSTGSTSTSTTRTVQSAPAPEALLTPAEVAALFKVDPKTITRWAKAGKLSGIRTVGGHRRYRESEVEELLQRKRDAK